MNDAWQRPKRTIHRFPDSLSGDTLHARESPILDNFAASVSIYLRPIPSRVYNHSLIPACVMNTYIRGEGVSIRHFYHSSLSTSAAHIHAWLPAKTASTRRVPFPKTPTSTPQLRLRLQPTWRTALVCTYDYIDTTLYTKVYC